MLYKACPSFFTCRYLVFVVVIEKNFVEIPRSIETVKVQNIFETGYFFNLFPEVSQIEYIGPIIIQIGKNNWDLEISKKS